jgi:uncharacterized membrane protein
MSGQDIGSNGMDNRIAAIRPPQKRAFSWAGYLLGFSLGGFFDGILLHQILQWHHLLSAVDRPPLRDLRVQVMADGLFHAAMYLIAAIALWNLFRARQIFAERAADRLLAANALIGFGVWHVVDAVLFHWTLEIHHIRMDRDPLFWDLLWFVVFGLLFIAAGLLLRPGATPPSFGKPRRASTSSSTALLLAVVITAAAAASALPPANEGPFAGTTTVVLRPGASPVRLLAGLQQQDARIIWSSSKGDVWVLALGNSVNRWKLYEHGAMFVSGSTFPAGCLAWSRPRKS